MAKAKKTYSKPAKSAAPEYCGIPTTPERIFDSDFDPFRASLIRYLDKKWVNGTELRYFFCKTPNSWRGGPAQKIGVYILDKPNVKSYI